jgi:hypothetical protein
MSASDFVVIFNVFGPEQDDEPSDPVEIVLEARQIPMCEHEVPYALKCYECDE